METKAFEILDVMTFIPVIATRMVPLDGRSPHSQNGDQYNAELYLLRRTGFGKGTAGALVIVCRMDASGVSSNATYDPHAWATVASTMTDAHLHIMEHWDKLKSGDVIDVEFIRGQTTSPKLSERLTAPI